MNTTKHDLSANTIKINLNNLIELASLASGLARTNCERALSDLQNGCAYGSGDTKASDTMYAARRLSQAAQAAEVAFENLYYLQNAKTRDEVIVIK